MDDRTTAGVSIVYTAEVLLVGVMVAALAASAAAGGEGAADAAAPVGVQAPARGTIDAVARLLAGMRTDVPAREWWARGYSRRLARAFEQFEAKVGAPMEAWAARALVQSPGDTVFYPFAGADFPTAHRLYPTASRYVLVAMQRGGPPPKPDDLDRDDRAAMLATYEPLLTGFLRRGFFVTQEMNDGTTGEAGVRGITGLLLAFAVREGFAIRAIEPIHLGDDGSIVVHEGDRDRGATWDSVRIHLTRRGDGEPVVLEYLRVGLSNMNVKPGTAPYAFVAGLTDDRVILKAASHLPQDINFSAFTELVLRHAPTIVQDETGVAYDDLTPRFAVELYGSYAQVNLLFDDADQNALIAAYRAARTVPRLPFHVGYRKGTQACMLVATRPAPPVPPAAP